MKVLMVCLGNICRSPLAHGILEKMSMDNGLGWEVDSAGTSGWHDGALPDARSIEQAKVHQIDINNQRSRQLVKQDLDYYDLILVMDASNYNNVLKLVQSDDQRTKVKMIMNYLYPGENRVVPDPYYEGGFERVFQMIQKACEALVKEYS
jgi:protein-tyrosine phosphatase